MVHAPILQCQIRCIGRILNECGRIILFRQNVIRKDASNNAPKCLLAVVLIRRLGHVIKLLNLEDKVAKVMSNVTLVTTLRCERRLIIVAMLVLWRMWDT